MPSPELSKMMSSSIRRPRSTNGWCANGSGTTQSGRRSLPCTRRQLLSMLLHDRLLFLDVPSVDCGLIKAALSRTLEGRIFQIDERVDSSRDDHVIGLTGDPDIGL